MHKPPLFVVGCGRSGTTLLKTILSQHPEIYFCPETFFFTSVRRRIASYDDRPWDVARLWWLADAGLTPAGLRERFEKFADQDPDPERAIFAAILDHFREQHPGAIIGEKTPDHVRHLDTIRAYAPGAKIIQIMRDPRAVLASYKSVKIGSNAVADIAAEWATAADICNANEGRDDFIVLSYEALVSEPQASLERLLPFLGVKWDPTLLEFHNRDAAGFSPEQSHHANTLRPLFADRIEGWRKDLSHREIALLEHLLAGRMERFGYVPTGKSTSLPGLQARASQLAGLAHKFAVRVPRQRFKAARAHRRQRRNRIL